VKESISLSDVEPFLRGQTAADVMVGARFRTAARTITETDLVTFIAMTGINEPLFYDDAGPAEAGYAGRLVPGTLTFSYSEGLVMQTGVIHGTGLAFLSASIDVLAPVFVGDTITVVVEVLEARPTSAGRRCVVTTRNTVALRDGTVVMRYEPARLLRDGPTA
jgi:acyl dehydratase